MYVRIRKRPVIGFFFSRLKARSNSTQITSALWIRTYVYSHSKPYVQFWMAVYVCTRGPLHGSTYVPLNFLRILFLTINYKKLYKNNDFWSSMQNWIDFWVFVPFYENSYGNLGPFFDNIWFLLTITYYRKAAEHCQKHFPNQSTHFKLHTIWQSGSTINIFYIVFYSWWSKKNIKIRTYVGKIWFGRGHT